MARPYPLFGRADRKRMLGRGRAAGWFVVRRSAHGNIRLPAGTGASALPESNRHYQMHCVLSLQQARKIGRLLPRPASGVRREVGAVPSRASKEKNRKRFPVCGSLQIHITTFKTNGANEFMNFYQISDLPSSVRHPASFRRRYAPPPAAMISH